MKPPRTQYFIEEHRVTKKKFAQRNDEEVRRDYVQQQYLITNKVFSLAEIREHEKRGRLSAMRYKGGKYFKKSDVSALI